MWYLLLACPVVTLAIGIVGRFRPTTDYDRACAAIDARLDREERLVLNAQPAQATWIPSQHTSRVAPRPVRTVNGAELLAS